MTETVNSFFATSPSYIGTLSDVTALAAVAQRRRVPLMIDRAWGAHLDFLPGCGAIRQGADFAVTSVHKSLLGYSQTAVRRHAGEPDSALDPGPVGRSDHHHLAVGGRCWRPLTAAGRRWNATAHNGWELIAEPSPMPGVGWRGSVGSSFWMTPPCGCPVDPTKRR